MIIFVSFFFLIAANNSIAFAFTNETDQDALLEIKKMIPTDPVGILATWNNSIPVCEWEGIACGKLHQRVVSLDLRSSGLVGSMSPYVGNLSFLKVIDLSNNTFHGEIPSEIGKLFRLQSLILPNNSFDGQLPANLSRCIDLRIVIAMNNNLSGQIPAEMGYLSKLSKLSLDKNHLTGSIPPSFGNFSASLRVLTLSHNNLEGNIPLEIAKLSNLEDLTLSFNNFSGTIPSHLYNISSMESFSLSGNMLRGTLPSDLGFNFPRLKVLSVAGNQLHGPIPSSIGNASLLLDIYMNYNSLTGPIPLNLGNLHELRRLVVWGNQLGRSDSHGIGLQILLTSLSNCSKLDYLDLAINEFQGIFPKSIANLSKTITTFTIDGNSLRGNIPDLGYSNLVNIQLLSFGSNRLTGKIPPSIGDLSTLQRLYIFENSLSGEIPSSIGNLSNLGILALQGNGLEGNIPAFLGNCTSLQVFHLGNNRLYGPVPREIFGLSSLFGLSLPMNFLTGSIPVEVSKLVNLNYLQLADNKLSGEIPASIVGCQILERIRLQGNRFQGSIPESIKMMKGITLLDVSRNNLSGKIPRFLGQLTSLENLNLSYNMFEGEIPSEGVFKNISAFSVAGNKNMCGGIRDLRLPACQSKTLKEMKRHSSSTIIAIVAGSAAFVLLLLCLLALICCTRRSRKEASSTNKSPLENQYMHISYGELLRATDGFSPRNLIGEGRYGSVYKGIVQPNEQIVAVKVLKLEERGAGKSFFAECNALKNIRHRNLVKIITSCSSVDFRGNDFKALVFEYMENDSLDSWLHHDVPEQHRNLNLTQRLDIAIDVASALDYLHHQCEMDIIHCDLKPSNVLLDKDLCAHVADFGITKILSEVPAHQQSSSIGIRGTIGYVAPEYGLGEEATTRGDMYSYGILLLELLTGKRPTDRMFTDNNSLHIHAKTLLSDQVLKIVDPKILLGEDEEPSSNVVNIPRVEDLLVLLFKIAVSCSNDSPSERMNASDVVNELHKIRKSLVEITH